MLRSACVGARSGRDALGRDEASPPCGSASSSAVVAGLVSHHGAVARQHRQRRQQERGDVLARAGGQEDPLRGRGRVRRGASRGSA